MGNTRRSTEPQIVAHTHRQTNRQQKSPTQDTGSILVRISTCTLDNVTRRAQLSRTMPHKHSNRSLLSEEPGRVPIEGVAIIPGTKHNASRDSLPLQLFINFYDSMGLPRNMGHAMARVEFDGIVKCETFQV